MPDITAIVQELALLIVPFLAAITCHEVAHGYAAYLLGDPTAKLAGRLTLNPLKHLDPVGTLVLVLTRMIGWAKPVPVDSRYFKDPTKGMMLVSLAGPGANFALALLFALALHLMAVILGPRAFIAGATFTKPITGMLFLGVQLNLLLGVFNLLPIPPMDGSNILAGLLPPNVRRQYLSVGRFGMIIILGLAVTGLLSQILVPPVQFLMQLLLA